MSQSELKDGASPSVVFRVRLRKKTWKNPGTVFLDYHVYEEDISISSNWEVFLEVLNGKPSLCLFFENDLVVLIHSTTKKLNSCSMLTHVCLKDRYFSFLFFSFSNLLFRTREDEVHVAVGCAHP